MKKIKEKILGDFNFDEKIKNFLFPDIDNDIQTLKRINKINLQKKCFKIDLNENIDKQISLINKQK